MRNIDRSITAVALAGSAAFLPGTLAPPSHAASTVVVSGTAEATSTMGASIVTGDTFAFTFTLDLDSQAAAGKFNNSVTTFSLTAGSGNVGTWSPAGVNWQVSPVKNVATNENSDQLVVQVEASNAPAIDGVAFFDLGVTLQWTSSVVDVQPTVNGNTLGATLGTFTPNVGAAQYFFELRDANFASASFTAEPTSDNPAGPSSSSSGESPTFELNWDVAGGASCRMGNIVARMGTWTQVPTSDDCTPPTSSANAQLLGWATTTDFPVNIAQRQVDNGWGAYETFNDEGRLTGVFIPAGGATFVSNSTTLYPIWSE